MKMNKLVGAIALGSSLMFGSVAQAGEVTLNAVSLAPKKASISKGFHLFIDAINEKFDGELEIKWRGGPEVIPPFKQADSVRKGVIDIAFTSPSYYSGLLASSPVSNFSYKNFEQIRDTGFFDRMAELHAEKGLILLGEVPATKLQFHIFTGDKINGLADVAGKKVRVFPTVLPVAESLGASPLVLPMGEIFTAMERGAIDGFIRGATGWAPQFEGVVGTAIGNGLYRAGFPVLINPKAWNRLPEDLRTRVHDYVMNELYPQIDQSWDTHVAKGFEEWQAAGFEVLTLSDAEAASFKQQSLDAAWNSIANKAPDVVDELKAMLVD